MVSYLYQGYIRSSEFLGTRLVFELCALISQPEILSITPPAYPFQNVLSYPNEQSCLLTLIQLDITF